MAAYPPRRLGRILPRQSHRVPEPVRDLGGGRGQSSGERIRPTRGAAWAWQSIKGTQNPQPGIPNPPRHGCCELQVLGDFLSKLGRKPRPTAGRKTLGDCQQPPSQAPKAAGSGSDPPLQGMLWRDGDAAGDQGCWGRGGEAGGRPGMLGVQAGLPALARKWQGRAIARARPASAAGRGMQKVMRTRHCENQSRWTPDIAPSRAQRASPCRQYPHLSHFKSPVSHFKGILIAS